MIKFFRKIRQNLLMDNKTGKYFKYAIGEIILVVIGILIALQVNNLNEKQKAKDLEIKVLNEIRDNLQIDLIEIREDISLMIEISQACLDVKEHLISSDKPTDSLSISSSILRVTPHFRAITGGYELLKSRGIGLITNDSLRNAISYQYGMLYPYYKTYEEERSRFHALHSEPKLLEYFSMYFDLQNSSFHGFYFNINDEDYQNLQNDSKFIKLLTAIAFENDAVQNRAIRVENGILKLIESISIELENR